ncbi:hypothetical protein [Winslowiella toletana]|uniref:hypothetical protein n=1 Tax=Winslowiella toletana TaxID=92490 RepID=UPI0028BE683B|nr:hypothetical protein [Winslowiella toletana]WNN42835.1 hypothetical protein RIN69_14045 [Winslowiella toletana]
MNIKLTISDKMEIEKIIDNLSSDDEELIYERVKAKIEPMKVNPVVNSIDEFLQRHFDYDIIDLNTDDAWTQELRHQFVWDYTNRAEKWEYAVEIFKGKHSYQEVA